MEARPCGGYLGGILFLAGGIEMPLTDTEVRRPGQPRSRKQRICGSEIGKVLDSANPNPIAFDLSKKGVAIGICRYLSLR